MKRMSLLLGVLLLGLPANPAHADPIIVNADFETNADAFTVFPGYVGGGNPSTIPGWANTGAGVGINPGNGAGTPFRNNGADNTNVAFLQGIATLSQTVTGLTPGQTYQVTYDYNSRSGFPTPTQTVSLGGGSTTSPGVLPVGGGNPYYRGSFAFTAVGTSATLTISSAPVVAGQDATSLIDNIRITAVPAGTPQIANASFELPNRGGAFQYNPTLAQQGGSGWAFLGNSGVAANGSAFNVVNTPDGNQAGFLQQGGNFSQVINFPAGFTDTLSFFAEQRSFGGTQMFSVLLDGVPLTFGGNTVLTAPSSTSFTLFTSDSFSPGPGPHTLTFEGLNTNGDNTAFIDAVSITPTAVAVPEPSSFALLALGGGALAGWRRLKGRRSQTNPAA
jgi:hypothetical protein